MINLPNTPFTYSGNVITILQNGPLAWLRHFIFPYRLVHTNVTLCLAMLLILTATLIPNYRTNKDNRYKIHAVPLSQEIARVAREAQPMNALTNRRFFRDTVNNLILFAPFGMVLNTLLGQHRIRRRRRFWLILALAILLSFAVETCQLWYATRTSDIDDIITNGLGALLGAMAATYIHSGMVGVIFRQNLRFLKPTAFSQIQYQPTPYYSNLT